MKHVIRNIMMILLLITGCKSPEEKLATAMQKSVAWLWAQQDEDGGWHSKTHAVLKDGKALTPYILYHLLLIPEDKFNRPEDAVERGVEFIRREIRASIIMRKDSLPMLNYPNYSAAYALRVLCFVKEDTSLQRLIARHLWHEQFVEHRGITPDNLAYGGWGYGEPDLPYGENGHVDLSHTRRITEALLEFEKSHNNNLTGNTSASPPLKRYAETVEVRAGMSSMLLTSNSHFSRSHDLTISRSVNLFLEGVQRSLHDPRLYEGCISRKDLPYDGGFISSAATLPTNKSQPVWIEKAGYHYPSYATATCDGLLAMYAMGMMQEKAYSDAVRWLDQHQQMNTIEGLSVHDPEQWHQVMHYYHLAVRAEAMTAAGIHGRWSTEISRILIREQTDEGYYINPIGGVNKEDDPLMATVFAVQAGVILLIKA